MSVLSVIWAMAMATDPTSHMFFPFNFLMQSYGNACHHTQIDYEFSYVGV